MRGLMSIKERKLIFMTDIKIIKKTVAPAACWFTVKMPEAESEDEDAIIKIELDRAYPYIWINSDHSNNMFGLALTYEDIERAAIFDEETNTLVGFDLCADGILSCSGYAARCISAGARKSFYVIPGRIARPIERVWDSRGLSVSAQDTPICPFVHTSSSW